MPNLLFHRLHWPKHIQFGCLLFFSISTVPLAASGWSVDVLTGSLDTKQLKNALVQFKEAAKQPVRERLPELERCYRQFKSDFPDAAEIETIYVCELISTFHVDVAKRHLDATIKNGLDQYWPARRLAIYLHSTTESDLVVARMVEEFCTELVSREKRPEVMDLNVEWLGNALEGLRHSSTGNAEVEKKIVNCEQLLLEHSNALEKGRDAARQLVAKTGSNKQVVIDKIEQKSDAVAKSVKQTEGELKQKSDRLIKAHQTLESARIAFLEATSTQTQIMKRLQPEIEKAQQERDRLRNLYRRKSMERPRVENDSVPTRTLEKLQDAEQKLERLVDEYEKPAEEYRKRLEEFETKYASELSVVGIGTKDLRFSDAVLSKARKTKKQLENQKRSALAIHSKEFLRPPVAAILEEIERSTDGK